MAFRGGGAARFVSCGLQNKISLGMVALAIVLLVDTLGQCQPISAQRVRARSMAKAAMARQAQQEGGARQSSTSQVESAFAASSSKAAEEAARRAIPWSLLSQQDRRTTQYITRNVSVYRRLPTRTIDCSPESFTFLAQRPEVVASIWNVMGVSNLQLTRTSPTTFSATDTAGTQGMLRIMHADWGQNAKNRVVIYAEGIYEAKPLPRPIKAKSILLLRSGGGEGEHAGRVTSRLDSFVYFDRTAADLVAKTLQPLINRTADHNFVETMKFVSTFSQTAERNPAGVAKLADRLSGVDPQVRGELVTFCHNMHQKQAVAQRSSEVRVANARQQVR